MDQEGNMMLPGLNVKTRLSTTHCYAVVHCLCVAFLITQFQTCNLLVMQHLLLGQCDLTDIYSSRNGMKLDKLTVGSRFVGLIQSQKTSSGWTQTPNATAGLHATLPHDPVRQSGRLFRQTIQPWHSPVVRAEILSGHCTTNLYGVGQVQLQ